MQFLGPAPSNPGDLVTKAYSESATQTLSNKTLTDPKINAIKDSNGNNFLQIVATPSAVNYFSASGGAAGTGIALVATGADANTGVWLGSKGVSSVTIGTAEGVRAFVATPVASGVNYVQAVAGATGTGPQLNAAGSDANIDINLNPKGTGVVRAGYVPVVTTTGAQALTNKTITSPAVNQLNDTNGNVSLSLTATASAVNYWRAVNGITGSGVGFYAEGVDANVSANVYSKGTAAVNLRSPTNGVALSAQPVASGVNYIQAQAAATGGWPVVSAQGTDASIGMGFYSKGTGWVQLGSSAAAGLVVVPTTGSVNYAKVSPSVTGQAPSYSVGGTDADINLNLVPKGTGVVQANGVEVATTTGTQVLTNKTLTDPKINAVKDAGGNTALTVPTIASSANYLQLNSSVAGGSPALYVAGSDTNIGTGIYTKGSGSAVLGAYSGSVASFVAAPVASGVNYVQATAAATGNRPFLSAQGTDANIHLNLASKGTGVVQANGYELQTVSQNRVFRGGPVLNNDPEYTAETSFIPNLFNDLMFLKLRGGTVDVQKNGSAFNGSTAGTGFYNSVSGMPDNAWFAPDSSFSLDNGSTINTDTYVITVDLPASLLQRYSCALGIAFTNISWRCQDVTIEIFKGSTWTQVYSVTGSSEAFHRALYTNDGTTYTKIRYTLGRPVSTHVRIASLFSTAYDSQLQGTGMLPRTGGAVYGSSASPVTFTATGGDSDIGVNLVPKGTGTVQANGVPVVTTTGTQTLTGKTISGASNTLSGIPISAVSATGTPSGTTYLRGDGMWATPAGGGGGASGMLMPVQHHCDGTLTYTISGGSITQISGTQIQYQTVNVGDRILVLSAPPSGVTGAGSGYTFTTSVANGIYVVDSVGTDMSVSRAADMSGSVNPAGLTVFSENPNAGWGKNSLYTVATPNTAAAFTYGSGAIKFIATGGSNLNVSSVFIGGAGQIGWWNDTPGISTYLNVNSGADTGGTQNIYLPGVQTGTLLARVVASVTSALTFSKAPGTEYVYLLKTGAVPNLPTAVGNTAYYRVKNTTSAPITLTSTAGTIDGSTSAVLSPNTSVDLVSDGTNWFVL